uniref:G-protein coupled receptors family 1 profile domain-containing protein n=3 Tax=Clastoptera arizonana TaxID=38151 RepID=A0A1B6EET2_9HEMI
MIDNVTCSVDVYYGYGYGMGPGSSFWLFLDGVLFVVILCGNVVTLYVLRTSFQFSPLVSNQFVLSLALSDMLVGLTLPYHMAFYVLPYLATIKHTCILKFVFILFACCASILNVTAIAADRYFAIMHPFRYERIMNNRMARTILCCGWFHAIIFSTIPLYWNRWEQCEPCELGRVLPRYYTTAVITPAFCIVWAVMFIIYWRIWKQAVIQVNKLRQFNICKLRKSCFQVVLIIMGCFTVCWLPFLAVACVQAGGYHSIISPMAYKVVLSLAISSSAINPLIYAWKNREFKRTFGHMVRCRTVSHSVQQERTSLDKNPLNRNSGLCELQISV